MFLQSVKVCKSFFEVTKSPELNRLASFAFGLVSFKAVKSFLEKRGRHLWKLQFFYRNDNSELLKIAAKVCTSLKKLILNGNFDSAIVKDLSSGAILPNLEELEIEALKFNNETMSSLLTHRYTYLPNHF